MDPIRAVGIDLGSTSTGIAMIEVKPLERTIVNIEAATISTIDVYRDHFFLDKPHNELGSVERNKVINSLVLRWIAERSPDSVTFEQPFMNRFRPMSYGVLITQMNILSSAIAVQDNTIPMDSYAVQSCKKSIGAAGIKGKDVIKDYMRDHEELKPHLPEDYEYLSEHAIDAILVAYTHIKDKR